MSLLRNQMITVIKVSVGMPDEDGVPTETVEPAPWGPCNVQRASTTEVRDGNEITTTKLRAIGPLAQWINSMARITWQGVDYQVDGEPAHFLGGVLNHTEVDLIRWVGQ